MCVIRALSTSITYIPIRIVSKTYPMQNCRICFISARLCPLHGDEYEGIDLIHRRTSTKASLSQSSEPRRNPCALYLFLFFEGFLRIHAVPHITRCILNLFETLSPSGALNRPAYLSDSFVFRSETFEMRSKNASVCSQPEPNLCNSLKYWIIAIVWYDGLMHRRTFVLATNYQVYCNEAFKHFRANFSGNCLRLGHRSTV